MTGLSLLEISPPGGEQAGGEQLLQAAKRAVSETITNGGAGFSIKILDSLGDTPPEVLNKVEEVCNYFVGLLEGLCDRLTSDLKRYDTIIPQAVQQVMNMAQHRLSQSQTTMQQVHPMSLLALSSSTVPIYIKPGNFSSITEETNNAVSNIIGMARGLVTTQKQLLDNL